MGGTYFCTTELEQYSIPTGERQLVYETISNYKPLCIDGNSFQLDLSLDK